MPFIFFSFFFTADLPTTISYCAIWIQHAFKPIPSSWARYTFCCSSPGWVNSLTCISTQAVFELLSMATASVSHYQDYGLPSDSMWPFLASLCVWLRSHCRVTPFRIVFSKTVHLIIWLGFNWHFWYRSNFLTLRQDKLSLMPDLASGLTWPWNHFSVKCVICFGSPENVTGYQNVCNSWTVDAIFS